jgi:hypothetical protein
MNTRTLFLALVITGGVLASAGPASAQDSGYALKFDGVSDFVRLHPTSNMLGSTWTTAKTVSVWIKPLGAPCTAPIAAACDLIVGDTPRTWGISRGVVGGQDRIWVWNFDGSFTSVGIEYTAGQWIHVALVHGGGALTAYKNGELVGSVPSGATFPGAQWLYFGGAINNAQRNWTFEGEIDELQIWSVARTAAEIFVGAGSLLTGTEPGLAAYYQMSEGAGTSVADISGHGWTGTLLDGAKDVPPDGPITWVVSGALGGGTINNPPVGNGQNVTTVEDTSVAIVLSGSDLDGDPLTYHVVGVPAHGALSGAAPNLTYTPAPNYSGGDGFTFAVHDGRTYSAPATVSISVMPLNDPPVAADDTVTTTMDSPAEIHVLNNDGDPDGDALTIISVTGPAHGTVVNHGSYLDYTPGAGFVGTDSFNYTISDGNGGFAIALVSVTVTEGASNAGWALKFDGVSDFVRLSRTTDMMAPGWQSAKTISLWVRPTGTPTSCAPIPAACDIIFGDVPRWWGISRGVINDQDRIWIWNWADGLQSIAVPYVPGQWVHISLVHGGGVLSAYRNGVLVGSVPSGPTQQPTVPGAFPYLYIGGFASIPSKNWTLEGEIDEVQVWSVTRTPAQIVQDMSGPLPGWETGLSAYYRMTDGAGLVLTDDSGMGWTGTLLDGGGSIPPDGPILWVPSGAFSVLPGS